MASRSEVSAIEWLSQSMGKDWREKENKKREKERSAHQAKLCLSLWPSGDEKPVNPVEIRLERDSPSFV